MKVVEFLQVFFGKPSSLITTVSFKFQKIFLLFLSRNHTFLIESTTRNLFIHLDKNSKTIHYFSKVSEPLLPQIVWDYAEFGMIRLGWGIHALVWFYALLKIFHQIYHPPWRRRSLLAVIHLKRPSISSAKRRGTSTSNFCWIISTN